MKWLVLIAIVACAGSNSETGSDERIGDGSQGDEVATDVNGPAGHNEVCYHGEQSAAGAVSHQRSTAGDGRA